MPTVPTPANYAPVACLKITIVHNFIPVKSTKRKSVIRYIKRSRISIRTSNEFDNECKAIGFTTMNLIVLVIITANVS